MSDETKLLARAPAPQPAGDGALLKRLLAAYKAKDDLLACYHMGKHPSEALFKRLDKAKAAMEEAERALAQEQPR